MFTRKELVRIAADTGQGRSGIKIQAAVFVVFAFFSFLVCVPHATAARKKVRFSVPGIQCATSAVKATEAVISVAGVVEALDGDQTLTVSFDDEKTGITAIREALKNSGYPAEGEPRTLEE